jgi:NADH pyrophosphatase NudC (nudix superfamily)
MEADYVSGDATVNDPAEVEEVGWFYWNDLPEQLFLPFEHYLRQGSNISSIQQIIGSEVLALVVS